MPQSLRRGGKEMALPYFRLREAGGKEVSTWDFSQKRNLVVLFHHGPTCPECRAILEAAAGMYRDFERLKATILAISADTTETLRQYLEERPLHFLLLSDETGEAVNACLPGQTGNIPAAFVADRFGDVYARHLPQAHRLDLKDILADLFYIASMCPECAHEPEE